MPKQPVYVTQPNLPPLSDYIPYLEQIWENRHLTNGGPYHQQFESALCTYLGADYCNLFGNGTLALLAALKALDIKGEVITTPFTFVATSHAIRWIGAEPVFCDIKPDDFNIDVNQIEALITPRTSAILPVHVYGNPCDVERIEHIAEKHGLYVIYDAAHAFNVKLKGVPIIQYGDVSIHSFHATKLFHTFEGGATTTKHADLKDRIDKFKNFGFVSEEDVVVTGINAKMNELQAAFGVMMLEHYADQEIANRKAVAGQYLNALNGIPGISCNDYRPDVTYNYAYFPILVDAETYGHSRDELYTYLKSKQIFTRRYFYPLLTQMTAYRMNCKNQFMGHHIASQVLCLPMYGHLSSEIIDEIVTEIKQFRR